MWNGAIYAHPYHAFGAQPEADYTRCVADDCVQRLWCTDSGAVGWYSAGDWGEGAELTAAWIGHTQPSYHLSFTGGENANSYGHGAYAVSGNTIFFYTAAGGMLHLSSLVFSEWMPGAAASQLVSAGLRRYAVLGHKTIRDWCGHASPLYPSGPGAVTLSAENFATNYE